MEYLKLNKYLIKIINQYNDQSIDYLINVFNKNSYKQVYKVIPIPFFDILSECVNLGYSRFYISREYEKLIEFYNNECKNNKSYCDEK